MAFAGIFQPFVRLRWIRFGLLMRDGKILAPLLKTSRAMKSAHAPTPDRRHRYLNLFGSWKLGSKKFKQRVSRFLRPFLQDPMTGARKNDNRHIVGHQFHLRRKFVA